MQFKELSASEFGAFEQAHVDGTYMQSTFQHDVLVQRGWQSQYMGLVDDNNKIVAAELMDSRALRVGVLYEVSGGPLIDFDNADLVKLMADETIKYTRQHKGLVLRWLPNKHTRSLDNDGNTFKKFDTAFIKNLKAAGFTYKPSRPVVSGEYSKITLGYEFRKDLTGLTAETLEDSFTKDARYATKKTRQFGVKIRQLGYDELPEFKKYTTATAKRRGFSDKPLDYYQKTFKAYSDNVQFIFAELDFGAYIKEEQAKSAALEPEIEKLKAKLTASPKNKRAAKQLNEFTDQQQQHQKRIQDADEQRQQHGEKVVLAGGMFFTQPQEVSYMFSFTNEEFKRYYAPYLIQEHMMLLGIKKGIKTYNFYGVTGLFDGSDGVLKFKQSFNGYTYETGGEFSRPIRPVLYGLVNLLKKVTGRE